MSIFERKYNITDYLDKREIKILTACMKLMSLPISEAVFQKFVGLEKLTKTEIREIVSGLRTIHDDSGVITGAIDKLDRI